MTGIPPEQTDDPVFKLLEEDEGKLGFAGRLLDAIEQEDLPSTLKVKRFDSPIPEALARLTSPRLESEGFAGKKFLFGASLVDVFNLPGAAIENTANKVLETLGIGVTEEEIEGVRVKGSKTRDVTDTTIPLSTFGDQGVELSDEEQRVRNFNRFFKSGTLAAGLTLQGGLEKAYEEGLISRPETEGEMLADMGGQLLADIGITLPFIPGAGAVAKAGTSVLARSKIATSILNKMRSATTAKYGRDVGEKVVEETLKRIQNLGIDTEIGLLLGGLHATNRIAAGEDLSPQEFVEQVGLYGLFGLGAGALVQGAHGIGIARSRAKWQNQILSGPFAGKEPGFKMTNAEGDVLELVGKSGQGTGTQWKNTRTGKFVKPPDPEDIANYIKERIETEQAVGAAKSRMEEIPPVLPGLDQRVQDIQTAAAVWGPSIRQRAELVSREVLEAEMEALARQASDVGMPLTQRASLLGRARAIQEVLGELDPLAGAVTIETEQAAVEIAQLPRDAAMRAAARAEASGNPELASRVVSLVNDGLAEAKTAQVETALRGAGFSRGLVKGDRIRTPDGKQYVLLEDPSFGVALASEIRKGQSRGSPEILNLSDVVVRPKAGSTVRLKTGEVGTILEATGGKVRQIMVERPDGSTVLHSFDDVAELGHSKPIAKQHALEIERAKAPTLEGAQQVPPAEIVTPQGERGVATAVGPDGVEVLSRDGKRRIVRRVRPTKDTPTTEKQVLAFAPGTRPNSDNRILYFLLPRDQVSAFEQAYVAGGPIDDFLREGVHVLPPSTAAEDVALFAVELPSSSLPNRLYSTEARAARRALSGKPVKLEGYSSPVNVEPRVVGEGQVYRVPEALHAKAQRSVSDLANLTGEERTLYLRRLLDFSDDVDSPVSEAATNKRRAQRQRVDAAERNDGEALNSGKLAEAQAGKEAAEAMVADVVAEAEAVVQPTRRAFIESDPNSNVAIQRALEGDPTHLRSFVVESVGANREVTLLHKEVPGRVMTIKMEGDNILVRIVEGDKVHRFPTAARTVEELFDEVEAAGFVGGLHRRGNPGAFRHGENPHLRAEVIGEEVEAAAAPAAVLPRELAGAKPRYNFGEKQFTLAFESDIDKAAFITAQRKPSRRDADFLRWAQEQTGLSAQEVRELGGTVRSRIKEVARNAEPGEIRVPRIFQSTPRTTRPSRINLYQAERLAGSGETLWRLDATRAVGEGAEQLLEEMGFVRAEGLKDPQIPPPVEIGPPTRLQGGEKAFYRGQIAGRTAPVSHERLSEDLLAYRRQLERQEMAPVALTIARNGPGDVPGPGSLEIGRYRPTGQAVRIVDASDLAGSQITIEFPGGEVRQVKGSQVAVGKTNSSVVQDYRIAQSALAEGEEFYSQRLAAPLGLGKLERELGIFGTNKASVVKDRILRHSKQQINKLEISDGEVLGSPEAVDALVASYDRAIDLGFGRDVLELLPKEARDQFIDSAYLKVKQSIPTEEYGVLYAGAKFDKLSKQQLDQLREMGKEFKLKSDLPPHRVVEELWNRRAIDPNAARWTLEFRKEMGGVRLAQDIDLPPEAVTLIKGPTTRSASWFASRGLNPAHFEMLKDPSLQILDSMVRSLQENMQHSTSDLNAWGHTWQRQRKLTFPDGKTRKVKTEDLNWARDLVQEHTTWDDAVKAGAASSDDPRKLLFLELKSRVENWRERMVKLQMRYGVEPMLWSELDDTFKAQFLADHPWIDPSQLADDFYLVPTQVSKLKSDGLAVRKAARSNEEAEEMLALLREYATSEDLPVGTKEWMVDEFDLWKRFGRKNYWPLLHEGELALEVQAGTGWKTVGFSTSFPEAVQLYRQLRKAGTVGNSPMRVVQKKPYADDILSEHLSRKELFDMATSLRDATVADEEMLSGLFVPAAGRKPTGKAGAKPVRAPLKERGVTDLKPPVRDAWTEMKIQERRLSRLEYRHGVAEAYRMVLDKNNSAAQRLAESLAKLEGTSSIFSKDKAALHNYALRYVEEAIGLPGTAERLTNSAYAILQMLNNGPRIYGRSLWDKYLKGEEALPLTGERGIFNTENWKTFGASRQRASELVAFQAMWRMGFGPATAVVNATQYHMYTTPLLLREFGHEAMWSARGSWMNAVNLLFKMHRNKPLTGKFVEFRQIVEEAGIGLQPGRHLAGSSAVAGQVGSSLTRPVTFGLGKAGKAREWINFVSMYMFNGAEQVNRIATALSTYKAARHPSVKLSHEAAIAKVRETIAGSQFWYDELNLPMLMQRGGPAARVLLQFKPFMMNAVRYELDMATQAAKGVAKGDLRPAAAAAYHAAMFGVYGGTLGLLRHPLIELALWTGHIGSKFIPGVDIRSPAERRAQAVEALDTPPEGVAEEFRDRDIAYRHPLASRVLLHGVPGMVGMSLGSRLGFQGQDLNAMDTHAWAGPHVSVMQDFVQAVRRFGFGESKQRGSEKALLGLGIGFVAPQFVGGFKGKGLASIPFSRILSANIGGQIASQEWQEWLAESKEGRAFLSRFVPSIMRNWERAWDLYHQGFYRNIRGHPIEVPYGDRALEAGMSLGGFPSIRKEERQAYLDWLRPEAFSYESTKLQMARAAAAAYAENSDQGLAKAYEIIMRAEELGIVLRWDDIERQVERRNQEQMEAFIDNLSVPVRDIRPRK